MSRASGIGSWPGTSVRGGARRGPRHPVRGRAAVPARAARARAGRRPGRPRRRPARRPARSTCSRWAGGSSTARAATPARTASLLARGPRRAGRGLRRLHRRAQAAGAGPWTLAASVWLHRAERAVVDRGATRDLVASLAEGVRRPPRRGRSAWCRAPGSVLQLDEPGLPAVLAGGCPPPRATACCGPSTPRWRPAGLRDVLAAADGAAYGDPLLRPGPELAPAAGHRRRRARASTPRCWAPARLGVGRGDGGDGRRAVGRRACPPTAPRPVCPASVGPLVDRWREVGLPVADLDRRHGRRPTCGLAGLTPEQARGVQEMAADTARALTETAGS